MTRPERFPEFLDEWREVNGDDYTPLSYLDSSPDGLSFVVAAQWLFVPDFVEYRGGIFRAELPRGLDGKGRKVLDDWFAHFSGDVSKVEEKGNLLILWDLSSEADAHDDDLVQLARTLERLWRLQLKDRFPDREFTFEVLDGDGSYGPQVTFYSTPTRVDQAPVVVYEV
ncbi:hypothetical protein [Amycolatopsis sp. NPDC059021]|uniref:hypothetical protein n=1 Tax=Amycolatopsis sp. NPDC059021 TaxID=3346704 RepID=UPI003670A257